MPLDFGSLRGRRVAVLGDLMLDEQIIGRAARISPEAPVPVVEVTGRTLHPGGAANVAANIAALDGLAVVCGVVGGDAESDLLTSELTRRRIGAAGVLKVDGRATTRKSRVLANGQHVVRFDHETRAPLHADDEDALFQLAAPVIAASEVCVLSDYAKGVLTPSMCRRAIELCASRRIPVIADPKELSFAKYAGALLLTPNFHEASAAARALDPAAAFDNDDASVERIGALLTDQYGVGLLITRGARGMSLFEPDVAPRHIPALAHRVFDVTGAGDTVIAVLALAIAAGLPLADAAHAGNVAASLVVQLPGTSTVSLEEIEAAARP